MTPSEDVELTKGKRVSLAIKKFFNTYVPITKWLPEYRWKEYFLGDLMAGLTLSCIQIAQGMAFAIVAQVEPIMGLYTSCFPVFIYCIFGTAVVSSFGTVSVTSLMVGDSLEEINSVTFTAEELVEIITFLVGSLYLVCFVIRYDVVTKLFSRYMTNAFILACATQVIIKSMKLILGVPLEEISGYFSFVFNVYHLAKLVPQTNLITLGISLCLFLFLAINTYVIMPQMKKVTKIILPMELILLITITTVSYFVQLQTYDVKLLGVVPTGISNIRPPPFEATRFVWFHALVIGFVNLATTLAMVIMYNPDILVKQELLALGLANSIGSFLHTIPFGNSIMRTAIAQSCGIRTLLAQFISALMVLLAILFMGPVLAPLPMCALGCIVVYGLLMMVIAKSRELPQLFREGGVENILIWTLTGLATLFIAIEIGLLVGLLLTLRQYLANPDWDAPKEPAAPSTDKK